MDKEALKERTKVFSIAVGRLVLDLSYSILNKNYSNQLVRCSSSVGADYRAASRAKSRADFINKLKTVEEELDESMFFMELLVDNPDKKETITTLWKEANELLSIIVASLTTLRKTLAQS